MNERCHCSTLDTKRNTHQNLETLKKTSTKKNITEQK
jgi:hypothetical protein